MSAVVRAEEYFFVMSLTIMNRNKGVASCDVLSFDIIVLLLWHLVKSTVKPSLL